MSNGAGTSSILVNWGNVAGSVEVTETDSNGCQYVHEGAEVSF